MATYLTICGNATRDAELRFTPSGVPVANFGVAVNRRKKTASGDWEDDGADFYNITAWKELGENVANSVEKGQRVIVTGRVQHREWETQDGQKRISFEITADEIGPSLRWATAQVSRNEKRGGPPIPDEPPAYGGEEPF